MVSRTAKANVSVRTRSFRLQSRYWLLGGGIAGVLLSLIAISQTLYAYDSTFRYFQNVTLDSKAKIEESDAALRSIAQVSTDVVDSVITASNTQNTAATTQVIFDDFDTFRRDMFKVTANLESGPETDAFYAAERAVYDEFWPHITALLTAKALGDTATVIKEYSAADDILENKVIPNLTNVEEYNFAAMQRTERDADAAILGQLVILVIFTLGLAVLLTVLSVWLRARVRRYLTPALDAAVILSWLLLIGMFVDFSGVPGQLKSLVEDSYCSVSATQRIIAIATQANRTESAEILDYTNAKKWQDLCDQNDIQIQQAMCGFKDCINTKFNTRRADIIDPDVITQANRNFRMWAWKS